MHEPSVVPKTTPVERPIPRWIMREALCLSFYGTPWATTSAFRRGICDDMARDALAALAEAGLAVREKEARR